MAKDKGGRKPGATNREYDLVDKVETRCKKCRSTKRGDYIRRTENVLQNVQVAPDGMKFNVIVYRTCQCLECLQWRRDRSLELREVEE